MINHAELERITTSNESNTAQLNRLAGGFKSFFEQKGYGFVPTRTIVNPDRSLPLEPEFTVDHLCHLKTEILTDKLPHPGEATVQDCLRTQNLYSHGLDEHATSETSLPFCLYFRMLSVTTPASENIIPDGWEYLVKQVGIKPEDIIIKISEKDTELMEDLKKNGISEDHFFIMKETDSDSTKPGDEREARPSYFQWDYGKASGFENIYGRGLTFAVRAPDKGEFTDVGNLIAIKDKEGGKTIAWEYGFGLEVLSATLKGEATTIRASEEGDLVRAYNDGIEDCWNGQWDAVADCVVGASNIIQAGIRPEGAARANRILKDILNKAAQLGIGIGLTTQDIAVMVSDYSRLRFGGPNSSQVNDYYGRHQRSSGKTSEEIIQAMILEMAGKPGMDLIASGLLGFKWVLPQYDVQDVKEVRLKGEGKTREQLTEEKIVVATAGRILSLRVMGKIMFMTVGLPGQDNIQIMINVQDGVLSLDEFKALSTSLKNGDWIECQGALTRTKTGELTIHTSEPPNLLTPTLIPANLKHTNEYITGVQTTEIERSMARNLEARAKLNESLRNDLNQLGFIEVETPIIEGVAGGASAAPFMTYINAIKHSGVLRIAPELKLKSLLRLLPRIYELGKIFRNEGADAQHNPEFTMIEGYMSYALAYRDLIPLMHTLIKDAAIAVNGNTTIQIGENTIDLGQEWRQITFRELLLENAQIDIDPTLHLPEAEGKVQLKILLDNKGLTIEGYEQLSMGKILDTLYKRTARPNIVEPTIVYEYPTAIVPLARPNDKDNAYNDMFQLVAGGTELIKAYQELNDPITQLRKFISQEQARAAGDDEAMRINWDFVEQLIKGIPPCAGFGIGVDRLLSFLLNEGDIRKILPYTLRN